MVEMLLERGWIVIGSFRNVIGIIKGMRLINGIGKGVMWLGEEGRW